MAYPTDDVIETYARLLAATGAETCWWGRMKPWREECELCDCSGYTAYHYRMMARETFPQVLQLIEQTQGREGSPPVQTVICSENVSGALMEKH